MSWVILRERLDGWQILEEGFETEEEAQQRADEDLEPVINEERNLLVYPEPVQLLVVPEEFDIVAQARIMAQRYF